MCLPPLNVKVQFVKETKASPRVSTIRSVLEKFTNCTLNSHSSRNKDSEISFPPATSATTSHIHDNRKSFVLFTTGIQFYFARLELSITILIRRTLSPRSLLQSIREPTITHLLKPSEKTRSTLECNQHSHNESGVRSDLYLSKHPDTHCTVYNNSILIRMHSCFPNLKFFNSSHILKVNRFSFSLKLMSF